MGGEIEVLAQKPGALAADLHSTIDTLLIAPFLDKDTSETLRVIEVGGGYGRLFETMRYLTGRRMEYLLIDAVPASLMFAYLYLRKHYPELRIGTPYAGDDYAPGRWDVYVMPSWHIDRLADGQFDLAINIDSFQEMNQFHVDSFIRLFDRTLRQDGIVYLSNSRDYRFDGSYDYPAAWECRYMRRSPRSWTRHHPTEIFKKTDRDARAMHRMHQVAYMADLQLCELVNHDIIHKRANLRPVIPQATLGCTLRWPGPDDRLLPRHIEKLKASDTAA